MTAHPGPDDTALTGAWRTRDAPACADRYPDVLTSSTGTYLGARGPEQAGIRWDAGIYRLEDDRRLVLGVATDELRHRVPFRARPASRRRRTGGDVAARGPGSPGEGLPPVTRRRELFALVRDDICPRLFPFL